MATAVEEFLQKFHGVEGMTIAQRKKNFFNLLHQNASLKDNNDLLESITANLKPETFLESLFRLEFLIYFKRIHELIEILKQGNDIYVGIIIKQKWIFTTWFNDVDAEELVNIILPCLSFSVRMKVLKKLSQNIDPAKFDKIFDATVTRYGISVARGLVTGCTAGKIRNFLTDYPMKLTEFELITLYKKDPNLIEFYFKQCHNFVCFDNYKQVLRFLFKENFTMYNRLHEQYQKKGFQLKFGKRLTKRFVSMKQDDIIQSPKKFDYLNMQIVLRTIGKMSIKLFCNSLRSIDIKKYTNLTKLDILSQFPRKHHYNLIFNVVQDHYNIKIADHPVFINEPLLELIEDNNERAALAKIKVNGGQSKYIKYLTVDESIPLIKEKINVTSHIIERGNLISDLVETCYINGKDMNALYLTMKYFAGRHRNDDATVHQKFINKIETLFGFKNFTEEIWQCWTELLTIHVLKYDEDVKSYQKFQTLALKKFTVGTTIHQKFSYLNFLFQKNDPSLDELIQELFNSEEEFPSWGTYDKNFEKHFLQLILKDNAKKHLSQDQMELNCKIIDELALWNDQYQDDQFCFRGYPFLVDTFNYMMQNSDDLSDAIMYEFRNKIFTAKENRYKEEYLKLYWERLEVLSGTDDFAWFLTFIPDTIAENLNGFVSKIAEDEDSQFQVFLWNMVKKFSHLKLDERCKAVCIAKIKDRDYHEDKPTLVICPSVLMKPEEYVAFANLYKPINKSLDLDNESECEKYKLQCAIAENFKNTMSYEVIPALLNFCIGDYLKPSLRSLNSLLSRTPEKDVLQHCQVLAASRANAVRKHALYLTCQLTTPHQVEAILNLLSNAKEAQSLQTVIFASILKYFISNPSDQTLELVKKNMLLLTEKDCESHGLMVKKCNKVHTKYRGMYIQCCWEYLEENTDENTLMEYKKKLIAAMDNEDVIKTLHFDFVIGIIHKHLLGSKCISSVGSFLFSFLHQRPEKNEIVQIILKEFDKSENWRPALNIFKEWYNRIMWLPRNWHYLEPLLNYFEEKMDPIKHLDKVILLFFLRTKLSLSENYSNEELSERMFVFSDHLYKTYGLFVFKEFSSDLGSNLSYFLVPNRITKITFCLTFIKNHPLCHVAISVLDILERPKSNEITMYNEVRQRVKEFNDPDIQLYFYAKGRI